MADNSQNCPTVHFSHKISRMHGKLCNILRKRLQSLYNTLQCMMPITPLVITSRDTIRFSMTVCYYDGIPLMISSKKWIRCLLMMMLFCIRSRGILTTKIETEYYTNRFHKEYMRKDKTMFDACTVFNSWNTSSLFEVNDIMLIGVLWDSCYMYLEKDSQATKCQEHTFVLSWESIAPKRLLFSGWVKIIAQIQCLLFVTLICYR